MTTEVSSLYEASFVRNIGVFSKEEQERLRQGRVTVVGCGGVGGITLIQLSRLGVGKIHAVDDDEFEPSNLNRQMLSSVSRLGHSKADSAKESLEDINPDIEVVVSRERVTEENAAELLGNTDVVVDATDNLVSRVIVHRAAAKVGVPSIWIAVTPPFRGAVMSMTPDSTPYEVCLRQPSYQRPLTDDIKSQLNALKAGRALHSVRYGADEEWAHSFVNGKAPWAVISPVANIVGVLASFEALKFLLKRPGLDPVVGPELVRVNLAEPAMVQVVTPPEGTWDNTVL
ncbi:MAG TPA: ThiF family adenylyltransferase [Pseudonocardiaceae bacterium]